MMQHVSSRTAQPDRSTTLVNGPACNAAAVARSAPPDRFPIGLNWKAVRLFMLGRIFFGQSASTFPENAPKPATAAAAQGEAAQPAAAIRSRFALPPWAGRPALWLSGLILFLHVVGTGPAQAHVKWFAEYDVTKPPLPIGGVIDGRFVYFFLASVVVIYAYLLGRPVRLALAHSGRRTATLYGGSADRVPDPARRGRSSSSPRSAYTA